jgi:hypothetical protein
MWLCDVSTMLVLLYSRSKRTTGASLGCDIVMVVRTDVTCLGEPRCVAVS